MSLTFCSNSEKMVKISVHYRRKIKHWYRFVDRPVVQYLPLRYKERRRVSRNLDKSADKVVDVKVSSQLSSAQRQTVVDQCCNDPSKKHTIYCHKS